MAVHAKALASYLKSWGWISHTEISQLYQGGEEFGIHKSKMVFGTPCTSGVFTANNVR